ncbi:MAG TPA: hypothetical protein VGR02_12060 [Thermoanaerobaculia bacterium]|jgi:hypothetical protein|nr:hypothetical protein [Thermoanaerobaculia bacterium]
MKKTLVIALLLLAACGRKPETPVTESTETVPPATASTPPMQVETPGLVSVAGAEVPTNGLSLWLRADALVTTGPENTVTMWKSPNNMQATQTAAGRQPRLYPNAINGHAAVRFDGDDDMLEANLNIDPAVVPDATVIAVFNSRVAESSPLRKLYGQDDGDYDRAAGLDDRASEGKNYAVFAGGAGVVGEFTLAANTTYLTVDGWGAKTFNGWVNGKKMLDNREASNQHGLPHLYIGGTGTVFSEPWAGDVAEMLVYSRALTDAERMSIEDYLSKKYGIALDRTSAAPAASTTTQ